MKSCTARKKTVELKVFGHALQLEARNELRDRVDGHCTVKPMKSMGEMNNHYSSLSAIEIRKPERRTIHELKNMLPITKKVSRAASFAGMRKVRKILAG